eukprot:351955-Chlamydomonas_euryale.AAC.9
MLFTPAPELPHLPFPVLCAWHRPERAPTGWTGTQCPTSQTAAPELPPRGAAEAHAAPPSSSCVAP